MRRQECTADDVAYAFERGDCNVDLMAVAARHTVALLQGIEPRLQSEWYLSAPKCRVDNEVYEGASYVREDQVSSLNFFEDGQSRLYAEWSVNYRPDVDFSSRCATLRLKSSEQTKQGSASLSATTYRVYPGTYGGRKVEASRYVDIDSDFPTSGWKAAVDGGAIRWYLRPEENTPRDVSTPQQLFCKLAYDLCQKIIDMERHLVASKPISDAVPLSIRERLLVAHPGLLDAGIEPIANLSNEDELPVIVAGASGPLQDKIQR